MSKLKRCTRCNGTGKFHSGIDNDVCYKCEGAGYTGGTEEERALAIATREDRGFQRKVIFFICEKVAGKNVFSGYELWNSALENTGKTFEFNVITKAANAFAIPYTDDYSYVHTCINPSEHILKFREILKNHYCVISKIAENKIRVEFK